MHVLLPLLVQVFLKCICPSSLLEEANFSINPLLDLALVLRDSNLMIVLVHLIVVTQAKLVLAKTLDLELQVPALGDDPLQLRLHCGHLGVKLVLDARLLLLVATLHQSCKAFSSLLLTLTSMFQHSCESTPQDEQCLRRTLGLANSLLEYGVQALRIHEHCTINALSRLGVQAQPLQSGCINAKLRQTLHPIPSTSSNIASVCLGFVVR
mmetsp:Transcript_71773/g.125678  ORF Transcript_71773/g.125678 Transcript_71773/m.125678 type:complete len:210 (-) Transcript_71773:148-777(-)